MSDHLRRIIFIGPGDRLPKPLENSLLREISDLAVHTLQDWSFLTDTGEAIIASPTLILVDEAYGAAKPQKLELLQEVYPDSTLCLTFNGDHKSRRFIRECLKSGKIKNVLPMNLRLDLWLFAVQILLHGGTYMPPDLFELLEIDRNLQQEKERKSVRLTRDGDDAFSMLTSREREVLGLIALGMQNKNIAAKLNLSEHTIKLHIHHIIKKMGVTNRTEAAAAYIQQHEPGEEMRL